MKIAIQCDSPLLQRSLELFLEGHLSSKRHCNIVIRDKMITDDEYLTFCIASDSKSDLIKPFSKAQLLEALHRKIDFHHETLTESTPSHSSDEVADNRVDFEILEHHIEKLTREYQANILKAVRAFYEK